MAQILVRNLEDALVDCLKQRARDFFLEYEDVVSRPSIVEQSPLSEAEIGELLDAFASVCTGTTVYCRWRPNLVDEADRHLLELAIALGAEAIVTKNVRHLRSGGLRFPQIGFCVPRNWSRSFDHGYRHRSTARREGRAPSQALRHQPQRALRGAVDHGARRVRCRDAISRPGRTRFGRTRAGHPRPPGCARAHVAVAWLSPAGG